MSPHPHPLHQRVALNLARLLADALPADLEVLPNVEVTIDAQLPPSVRTPDIIVVPRRMTGQRSPRVSAADVVLVVEIVSPGSRGTDRVTKLREYARAGIPRYWIVDPTATPGEQFLAFACGGNSYRRLEVQTGERVRITEPAEMTFSVSDLVDRASHPTRLTALTAWS